MNFFSAHGYFT